MDQRNCRFLPRFCSEEMRKYCDYVAPIQIWYLHAVRRIAFIIYEHTACSNKLFTGLCGIPISRWWIFYVIKLVFGNPFCAFNHCAIVSSTKKPECSTLLWSDLHISHCTACILSMARHSIQAISYAIALWRFALHHSRERVTVFENILHYFHFHESRDKIHYTTANFGEAVCKVLTTQSN